MVRARVSYTELRSGDRRTSRIRQWNHNTAQFRPTTGQAGMRVFDRCLRARSVSDAGHLSPPAPRSSGRIGPA